MDSHGGTITFNSVPGKGSTFHLFFPLTYRRPNPPKKREKPKVQKQDKLILLLDDEDIILDITSELLAAIGYRVTSFQKADEAVAYYRDNWEKIDLLLVDMVMPQMNGREFFRRVKKINPEAKAYYFSGYTLKEGQTALEEDGVLGLISKPASQEILEDKLTEAFT